MDEPTRPRSRAIGVMFRREQDPATLAPWSRRVEEMGFDQIWVVEDCFYLGGIAQATIALSATERVKVGLGISPAVARNAAFLAMEYATLARAFPGRFIGGIGHGVPGWMEQIGERPASWLRSIEEITTVVRRILRGERVDMGGEYVRLAGVRLESAPNQTPPVLLGVRSEKSLRLAGRCADGLVLAECSGSAYVAWARSLMNEGRAVAGQDGEGQVVVYAFCCVDDTSPASALAKTREMVAGFNGDGMQPSILPLPFAPDMQEIIARGGRDALVAEMPDAWLLDLAITGSHADAGQAVDRLIDAGADSIVLVPPEDADWNEWLEAQRWAVTSRRW